MINDSTVTRSEQSLARWARVRQRLAGVLPRTQPAVRGIQFDPENCAPPDRSSWGAAKTAAMNSPYLGTFADLLRPPRGGSVRDGVIEDLAEYHQLTPEQVIDRCLHSEEESVREWREATDLSDFYRSIDSWTFNLLWYAYLQTIGFGYPETIVVADWLEVDRRGVDGRRVDRLGVNRGGVDRLEAVPANARMLDLGSGVGVTAQFFAALGYDVTLADVSPTLLDFARWRLERRGVTATYLRLPADLPRDRYDLITALDVMAHVPDPAETARHVHRALRPGGLFVANFDVRRKELQYAWHLHEDDRTLRWAIHRAGFTPITLIDNILWVYRAEPTTGVGWRLRAALGWLRLASPPVRVLAATRRALARAAFAAAARLGR